MSDNSFLHSLKECVRRYSLIEHGDRIIVAVSGGIDSVVLADSLNQLQREWDLTLAFAHFNYQLRGKESDEDEAFVRSLAKEYGYECYVEKADTHDEVKKQKRSLQETARDLRYEFFTTLRQTHQFHKIATAHHADDNAETVLFNLLRGTGVNGMAGIPVTRKDLSIVRPFLFATREQIRQYAESRKLRYREDSSNLSSDYTRNFLRREIIPQLRENINPNLTGTLKRTSELFDQLQQYLQTEAEKILSEIITHRSHDEVIFDLSKFSSKPMFIQEYMLLLTAREFTQAEIDFSAVQNMLNIATAETGSWCSLTKTTALYRDRDRLVFKRTLQNESFEHIINTDKEYTFDGFQFASSHVASANFTNNPYIEYVDAGCLGNNLHLRTWHDGDWFIPLGMKDKKKVSDFFIEQKIPLYEKHTIPIFESDGNIVWICGKRLDERFKVTAETKKILKLAYSEQQT